MGVRVGLDEIQHGYEAIIGEPDGDSPFEGATLVLRGADSHYVSDDMLPALREVLPRARLVTLKTLATGCMPTSLMRFSKRSTPL